MLFLKEGQQIDRDTLLRQSHAQALRLELLALFAQFGHTLVELFLDRVERGFQHQRRRGAPAPRRHGESAHAARLRGDRHGLVHLWTRQVVAVLPVPVAPISTTSFSPFSMRVASSSIAWGWSPEGLYGDLTTNGLLVRSILNPMERVFGDGAPQSAVATLNGIMHPQVYELARNREHVLVGDDPMAILTPRRTIPQRGYQHNRTSVLTAVLRR